MTSQNHASAIPVRVTGDGGVDTLTADGSVIRIRRGG